MMRLGRNCELTQNAHASLSAYGWPGNLRELARVVAGFPESGEVDALDLPTKIKVFNERCDANGEQPLGRWAQAMAAAERELCLRALHETNNSAPAAARYLGLDRSTFYHKLRKRGLRP